MKSFYKHMNIRCLVLIGLSLFTIGFIVTGFLVTDSTLTEVSDHNIYSFYNILLNNIKVCLLILISGYMSLGLFPVIIMFINGFYFGSHFFANFYYYGFFKSLSFFIFHGPLELFALSLTFALSVKLPWNIFLRIWNDELSTDIAITSDKLLKYVITIISLLLFASVTEFYVIENFNH